MSNPRPICLVIAPSGFLLDERVFMSLGILRIAAVLETKGIPVEVLTSEYTIGYIPSGTFLARRGKPIDKPATLLAIGFENDGAGTPARADQDLRHAQVDHRGSERQEHAEIDGSQL